MTNTSPVNYPSTWKKPPLIESDLVRRGLWLSFAIYLALALGTIDVNWGRVAEGIPRGQKFLTAFFPTDITSRWDSILDGILESIWMMFGK